MGDEGGAPLRRTNQKRKVQDSRRRDCKRTDPSRRRADHSDGTKSRVFGVSDGHSETDGTLLLRGGAGPC